MLPALFTSRNFDVRPASAPGGLFSTPQDSVIGDDGDFIEQQQVRLFFILLLIYTTYIDTYIYTCIYTY
jgi:hypothetical protein